MAHFARGNELCRPERQQDKIAYAGRDSYLGEAAFRSERDQLRLPAPFGEVADIGTGQCRRVDQHDLRGFFTGQLEVPIVVDDRGLDAMLRQEPLEALLMARAYPLDHDAGLGQEDVCPAPGPVSTGTPTELPHSVHEPS